LVDATTVDLSLSLPEYSESLTNQFNPLSQRYEFYQLKSTQLRSSLSINQPISLIGGTLSLSGDFFKRNQSSGQAGTIEEIKDYFSYFRIGFQQPLFSPNVLRITKNQANLRISQANSNYVRDQLDIIYEVTEAFFTTYRLGQVEQISAEQVTQNEESYKTAKGKFTSGLIPEVELLQSEVDLVTSRNQLLNDQREALRAANALKLLLGLPMSGKIVLKADLQYTPVRIDQDIATQKALENRSEMLNAQRAREISSMDIDLASSQRHIRFDLSAGYGLNRNDTRIESVFQDFGRTRTISLGVMVPIFDWGRHSRAVDAARAQWRSTELTYTNTEQQIRQEILDLISRITVAESRIQVLAKSVEVAQKSYEISIERFRVGTITSNDLALAQQRLTTSKLNNLVALIDYRLGIADLTRKTLWDFEKNQPVIILPPPEN
jgi:outer membrane protein TolC